MKRKRLLSLLVLLAAVVTGAWAQTWDSGDCTVTLSDGVVAVSGTGAMEDYEDYSKTPWYGKHIKTIVIESGVTSIGNFAFSRFSYLESVSIPASVTSIGNFAFDDGGSNAEALTVSFAEGSTLLTIGESAFKYANLKSIDIPNRVTSIGRSAFSSCTYLESVSIPASVTSIGEGAFYNCTHLESVSIPASVTSIGVEAFRGCGSYNTGLTVSFAEGSTPLTISEYAFADANLTSIDISNRVTSIGQGAFTGCI